MSAIGVVKNFVGLVGGIPTVNIAAAAGRIIAAGVGNPTTVESPSITTTADNTLLLAIFVARNGKAGTAFAVPAGMTDLAVAVNLQTSLAPVDALGRGVFVEYLPTTITTGTRSTTCDIDVTEYANPYQGMGYALAIAGCGGTAQE